LQEPWFTKTFPHAKADTSNTGWYRNEGVLYGFFAGKSNVSPALSLVDLSMLNCRPLW
jgi:hypothetical protein